MHNRILPRTLASLGVAALLPLAPAPAGAASDLPGALDAIAAYAPAAMREQGTPGLSVAITDRTRTLRVITIGYANRETRSPVTPQTRFAIGSITKSMTALALLELKDAGRVDLNAPARHYLPWFSIGGQRRPVLVHELLSHTAGLPDDFALEAGYLYDVVALRRASTLFPPGTSWSYSNDGYGVAGAILAWVDRRSWADAVDARVFAPIGMTQSSDVFTPAAMAGGAVGYQFRDNDRPPPPDPPPAAPPPLD